MTMPARAAIISHCVVARLGGRNSRDETADEIAADFRDDESGAGDQAESEHEGKGGVEGFRETVSAKCEEEPDKRRSSTPVQEMTWLQFISGAGNAPAQGRQGP